MDKMDKITSEDLASLRIFLKINKNDKDSPIVWLAEIVEKLARQSASR